LETELKLRFESEKEMMDVLSREWFADIVLPDSEKTMFFDTLYFDTKDQLLRSIGASVRIREVKNSHYIHTVKIGGTCRDGLHQRYEWNFDTDSAAFDTEAFLIGAVSDGDPLEVLIEAFDTINGKELIEICKTSFERTLSLVGFGDSLIEICLDSGTLYAKSKKEHICEMEVELKQGDVRDVLALGDEIISHTGAIPDNRGKYARCLMLLDGMNE